MELMTGYSAREALGRPMNEVFGFHRNEYVRRCHVSTLLNMPWPWYAAFDSAKFVHTICILYDWGSLHFNLS